ncbi:MAG: hypothetical protein QF654_14035 [Alphaproteobacteria bacterium]|jgi:hypothetical protein|nr:hypothetical protein [Alphaproteobacteria bacterium]MDP6604052.1 hypothetical protein [Rhodospirillales bacterium]|tara:strand:+ start:360 stop:575 length:216 start_codon:yes stop_codon:yes gene_type:complete
MELVKFEVGVFNQEVRDAMKLGERHSQLKDDWADIHWVEVRATDEKAARQKVGVQYPASRGYVITEVVKAF